MPPGGPSSKPPDVRRWHGSGDEGAGASAGARGSGRGASTSASGALHEGGGAGAGLAALPPRPRAPWTGQGRAEQRRHQRRTSCGGSGSKGRNVTARRRLVTSPVKHQGSPRLSRGLPPPAGRRCQRPREPWQAKGCRSYILGRTRCGRDRAGRPGGRGEAASGRRWFAGPSGCRRAHCGSEGGSRRGRGRQRREPGVVLMLGRGASGRVA